MHVDGQADERPFEPFGVLMRGLVMVYEVTPMVERNWHGCAAPDIQTSYRQLGCGIALTPVFVRRGHTGAI